MGFIKLNRFGDPAGSGFDVEAVIARVRQTFADATVLPGDQLALSADRATLAGAAEHVVRALRRNQQEYGPRLCVRDSDRERRNHSGTGTPLRCDLSLCVPVAGRMAAAPARFPATPRTGTDRALRRGTAAADGSSRGRLNDRRGLPGPARLAAARRTHSHIRYYPFPYCTSCSLCYDDPRCSPGA